MVDPIADMLNRLKNAQAVQKETAEVPFSRIKYALAKILERNGYIKSAETKGKKTRRIIEIGLVYEHGSPRIVGVKRVSKPGQRVYAAWSDVKKVKGGQGMAVLSTSRGLFSGKDARKERVGGEILCEIW